jgi:hypothetical protein
MLTRRLAFKVGLAKKSGAPFCLTKGKFECCRSTKLAAACFPAGARCANNLQENNRVTDVLPFGTLRVRRSACFIPLIALLGGSCTASRSDKTPVTTEPRAGRSSSMSNGSMLCDLFDRWERVSMRAIRADPRMRRTVLHSARRSRSGRIHTSLCTIIHSGATARGSALRSSGLIQRPPRRVPDQACRSTGSRLGSSRRLGLC